MLRKRNGPKVLIFDIETIYMEVWTWGLYDQNHPHSSVKKEWAVISWAAKWLDEPAKNIMYQDNRKNKDIRDDKKLLEGMWDLLDEADIVVTKNGIKFDAKKLNARFLINKVRGGKPPSPYKHIDTERIVRSKFAFTSNSLDYLSDKLCKKYKKLKHKKYPGIALWHAVSEGNQDAWKEMERYNKHDVFSTEELYHIVYPWDNSVNFNLWRNTDDVVCNCGSEDLQKRGFSTSSAGRFQRFQCQDCGAWTRSKENLLSKEKRASLRPRA